jgi:hypothetical protein
MRRVNKQQRAQRAGADQGESGMATRLFMGVMGLMWVGYGLWCFINPLFLHEAAGIAYISATGNVDLRATYGGLQMAIGVLLLAGALRVALTRQMLVIYGVLCAGIGSARLVGALLESEWSGYTSFAVGFELGTVALVMLLLVLGRRATT